MPICHPPVMTPAALAARRANARKSVGTGARAGSRTRLAPPREGHGMYSQGDLLRRAIDLNSRILHKLMNDLGLEAFAAGRAAGRETARKKGSPTKAGM